MLRDQTMPVWVTEATQRCGIDIDNRLQRRGLVKCAVSHRKTRHSHGHLYQHCSYEADYLGSVVLQ
jgi:hypothetical protein